MWLTKKQEDGVIEWKNHCLSIGRDTSPVDKQTTEKSGKKFYKILGKKEPSFRYFQSPFQMQIAINTFKDSARCIVMDNVWSNIVDNIWYNIMSNIPKNIVDNIKGDISGSIGGSIRGNIWRNIWDNITGDAHMYSWCQHDINWIGYYKYYTKYGLLKQDENFDIIDIWYDLAKSCGWCYTYENMVFVCEKPCEIHLNDKGRLHKDGDMALKYSDGHGLYVLNGVQVPKYLVITPTGGLDVSFFQKEKNADIKAQFIRKYGIDRMVHLGKSIDSYKNYSNGEWWNKSEYELIDMANIFESIDYAPHIKMINQTVKGLYHLEAVSPECKNLEQAMNFREKTREKYRTISIK